MSLPMKASLLEKLFGNGGQWSSPCVVILDADADVQTQLGGKEPKRVIIVPGRLINIVL